MRHVVKAAGDERGKGKCKSEAQREIETAQHVETLRASRRA
jgi:hypothetical protein